MELSHEFVMSTQLLYAHHPLRKLHVLRVRVVPAHGSGRMLDALVNSKWMTVRDPVLEDASQAPESRCHLENT